MIRLLLDTHIWVWWVMGSPKLPSSVRERLDAPDTSNWLSPISVWELAMLVERKRVSIDSEYRTWLAQTFARRPLREATLTFDVARRSREIELPQNDPADRFLAATALVYDLVLVTVDRRLVDAEWLPTLSS